MKISFALMSGGQGKRFGSDKTMALLNDKPLYRYGLELGLAVSDDVLHISRDVEKYKPFVEGVRYLADGYPNMCPMAGMITAADNARFDYIFVLSADTPLLDKNFVTYFKSIIGVRDAVIPSVNGKYYTLAALYSKKMLLALKPFYYNGNYKIVACLNAFSVYYPDEAELASNGRLEGSFANINTRDDLEKSIKYSNLL